MECARGVAAEAVKSASAVTVTFRAAGAPPDRDGGPGDALNPYLHVDQPSSVAPQPTHAMSTALHPSPSAGYYALAAGSEQTSHLRPQTTRRDTDNILSYYQSEHAGRTYLASDAAPPPSVMRTDSGSSSDYSSNSRDLTTSDTGSSRTHSTRHDSISTEGGQTEGGHRRRPSVPSEGGADRRRLAIVELDDSLPASLTRKRSQVSHRHGDVSGTTTTTLSSRRGIHVEGLALVAPPDASPRTYTDLTPPSTAPLSTEPPPSALRSLAHQRSQSEVTTAIPKSRHQHKSSRDIGIVGAVPSSAEPHERPVLPAVGSQPAALKVPIFQTPADSRSPTPGSNARTPDLSESGTLSPQIPFSATLATSGHTEEAMTPAIGESKDITQPVVGPVIVNTSEALRHRTQDKAAQSSVSSPGDVFASRQTQMSPSTVVAQPQSASAYVHYEPGVHSRAGPMPAPPLPLFDVDPRSGTLNPAPPRPPRAYTPLPPSVQRDPQALREALQLPQSVSTALASKRPTRSPKRNDSEVTEESVYSQEEDREPDAGPSRSLSKRSMHVREGAHPPSTSTTTPPLNSEEVQESRSEASSLVRRVEANKAPPVSFTLHDDARSAESVSSSSQEPSVRSRKDLRRESSWVSMAQERVQRALSPGRGSTISRSPSTSPSMFSPTPPPKSIHGSLEDVPQASGSSGVIKGALTNLKRFSALPRTPSVTSARAKSPEASPQVSPRHSKDAPLPAIPAPLRRRVPRPRITAEWPDAMSCRDVVTLRTPLERAAGYANKINELALYDCGLTDWLQDRRYTATGTRTGSSSKVRLMVTPATPASRVFVPQPRHTSRGSEASEMTFPVRPDAYSATDLTTRPTDLLPPTAPALPYPSLAQAQQKRSPARSSTLIPSPSRSLLPLPGHKSSGGGFFSSIGRKTSVKKDRPIFPPNQAGRLSKRNTATPPPAPRPQQPAQPVTAPAVPGGPRAAPGRVRRSQTFSAIASPPLRPDASTMPTPTTNTHPQRQSTMRRPSLFARAKNHGQSQSSPQAGAVVAQPALPNPEFDRQVDRLADLLPHADRDILAGYLRRAGQDMLAIGQYLEDEKNGSLRRE